MQGPLEMVYEHSLLTLDDSRLLIVGGERDELRYGEGYQGGEASLYMLEYDTFDRTYYDDWARVDWKANVGSALSFEAERRKRWATPYNERRDEPEFEMTSKAVVL